MYGHQTRQQHVLIPEDHKAFSKLWPHIIEIREGGVSITAVLRAVEKEDTSPDIKLAFSWPATQQS